MKKTPFHFGAPKIWVTIVYIGSDSNDVFDQDPGILGEMIQLD